MKLYGIDWKSLPSIREGDDVASYLQREGQAGQQALKHAIEHARPIGEIAIGDFASRYADTEDYDEKEHLLENALELIRKEPSLPLKRQLIQFTAERFDIHPATIARLAYPDEPEQERDVRGGVEL